MGKNRATEGGTRTGKRPGRKEQAQAETRSGRGRRRRRPPQAPPGPEELPESYGETFLALLPVDPYLVHAYWELPAAERGRAARALRAPKASLRAVLRFHEVTGRTAEAGGGGPSFDVEVDPEAGNWYVPLWSAGRSYVAELGFRTAEGRFRPAARSGVAVTPRAEPSPVTGERYLSVSERGGRLRRVEVEAGGAPPIAPALPPSQGPMREPGPEAAADGGGHAPPPTPGSLARTEPPPEVRAPEAFPPGATPGVAQPSAGEPLPPGPIPGAPADPGEALRNRLPALYRLAWADSPAVRQAAPAPLPPLGPARGEEGFDLTDRCEAHFAPGLSSRS